MTRKINNALATLRQLAELGLPPAVIFSDLAARLKDIVDFEVANIVLLEADGSVREAVGTRGLPLAVNQRYLERWFNREEGRYHPTHSQLRADPAARVVRVSDHTPRFAETELYAEIHSHWQAEWLAIVVCRDGKRMIGNLGLCRRREQGDFSDAEMRLLDEARPLISRALSGGASTLADAEAATSETAMLRLNADGQLASASVNAWRMLRWAQGLPIDGPSLQPPSYDWAEPFFADIVRQARTAAPAEARALRQANRYGEFVIRANVLVASDRSLPDEVGVQIARRLPLSLALFRSAAFRALSNRERTVAQALVKGATHGEIAALMGVKPSTVVTHVRNLYARLDVNSREALTSRFAAEDI